jgi:hypothetical protein
MPSVPSLISVKAGRCLPSARDPKTIVPSPEAGQLYLYNNREDEFLHFCWKPRGTSTPVEDLIMVPANATFVRYPIPSGRIFVLKFHGSSQRHFYWLQTKPDNPDDLGHFSAQDEAIERTINRLLRGDEDESDDLMEDEDESMEDVERRGDGSDARDGGADGGRA